MTYLMFSHRVDDFGKWKKVFDEHADLRREGGSTEARVLRGQEDPNQVVVITRWASALAARKFMGSPALKSAMAKAGVGPKAELILLDEIEFQPH